MLHRQFVSLVCAFTVALSAAAYGQAQAPETAPVDLDAPYVPTPMPVVNAMLTMASVGNDDIVYDLGSGDGRLVVTAVRDFHAKKGVGVELDPVRIAEARDSAQKAGVSDRAVFHQADLFKFDFSEATVLTMYLLPHMILELRPRIAALKPGSRVVSHDFHMGDWEADTYQRVDDRTVYFWVVPAEVAGTWEWDFGGRTYRAVLNQKFQKVFGTVRTGDAEAPTQLTILDGASLRFEARLPSDEGTQAMAFTGQVSGDTIKATVVVAGRTADVTARRLP